MTAVQKGPYCNLYFFNENTKFLKIKTDGKTERQTDRKTNRKTDRKTDRKTERKTERFFSLLIKTKVVQNVNWMSER